MGKLRKFTTRLLSVTLAAVMSLFAIGTSAFASRISYKWTVDWSASKQEDWLGWKGNGSSKFFTDDTVHTPDSEYSIRLDNTDYNVSYVERTYNVEPRTTYKFSAMVKYSGYALSPGAKEKISGATVGKAYSYNNSGYTTSSDWTLMEYEFTTNNETTYNLALQNGIFNGDCKGTAWFCDVKLEKAEMTNSWNILAVFFKNVNANGKIDGKQVTYKDSITESQQEEMQTYILDKLPDSFKEMTKNKMNINSIDCYTVNEVLTEKDLKSYQSGYDDGTKFDGYYVDSENSALVSKTLDKYLAQKHYNQIIIFAPILDIFGGAAGLTVEKYKSINHVQITSLQNGYFKNSDFSEEVALHEITHCLERVSKTINGDKTPSLDNERKYYQAAYGLSVIEWYTGYLNATLPDGRGLDPSVFNVTSGKYTLISDDMTTGDGIAPISTSATPVAPKNLIVKSIADGKVHVSWDTVTNASGYQLALFKSADCEEIWTLFNCTPNTISTDLSPIVKGKPYYYGIRTVANVNGTNVYSDWTTVTFTHTGVGIVRGDVDNNGVFDFDDISAAIDYFLNGTEIDRRTADAADIAERDYIDFSDIEHLIDLFLAA